MAKDGGGGNRGGARSAPAPAPAPTPPPAPAARAVAPTPAPQRDGGGKKDDKPQAVKAPQAVAVSKSYQRQAAPTDEKKNLSAATLPAGGTVSAQQRTTPSSGGDGKKQERVETLTQRAKDLISGATATGIADPAKFKDVLGKLKDLGKDKQVAALREQKTTAVTAARDAAVKPGDNNQNTGYTQEQLDQAIKDALSKANTGGITKEDLDTALAGVKQTGLTQEDLDAALSKYGSKNAPQTGASDTGAAAASTSEFDDWLKSFSEQQDVGAFDPDLFRNLLGELESSKYRQKQWNERSARAAYTY